MTQEYLTGKSGKVAIDGADYNVTGWKFDPQCEVLETTHSGSAGFRTFDAGIKGGTGEATLNCPAAAIPENLAPGTELANVELFCDSVAEVPIKVAFALGIVSGLPIACEVKGLVTITLSFTVKGEYLV